VLQPPYDSTRRAIEKASHDLSAKLLSWCLGASPRPVQLLIGLITWVVIVIVIVIDARGDWIVPSCLTQVLTKVWIELASLKAQDKVVKDKAATNEHEGHLLVFFGRNLDAKFAKCLKSTFEQPYRMLGAYSNLSSLLVKSSHQPVYIRTFDRW
jgi:hypothetical protein